MKFLVLIALILLSFGLFACSSGGNSPITIQDAWVRPAFMDDGGSSGSHGEMGMDMGGSVSAAFMLIRNQADTADRLLSAETTAASTTEIHMTEMVNDVMKMRPVEGGLEIPARGQVELKPGSYHLMLIDVTQDLLPGDKIPLLLKFEKAGEIRIEAEVKNP
jgi:copper(I)-binding protein